MAKTGIDIKITNTVLGSVANVDGNSMLIVVGAKKVQDSTAAFSLDQPYLIQTLQDLDPLGITATSNPELYKELTDAMAENVGGLFWIVGTATKDNVLNNLPDWLRFTTLNGYQYRPRQIAISEEAKIFDGMTEQQLRIDAIEGVIASMYAEGFATCCVVGTALEYSDDFLGTDAPSGYASPHVAVCVVTDTPGARPCVGKVLGYMASLSVGTSIGDTSLPSRGSNFYLVDYTTDETTGNPTVLENTPCARLSLSQVNNLGEAGFLFTRTRPPRNGMWWNDGATADEADNAMSTLEMVRTIASLVDNLRDYFTGYLNTKTPVSASGDIDKAYKQTILTNAKLNVISPFIETGSISDARISLKAKDDNMVASRTWQVTVEVLPAPTLRWVEASVFYVKTL